MSQINLGRVTVATMSGAEPKSPAPAIEDAQGRLRSVPAAQAQEMAHFDLVRPSYLPLPAASSSVQVVGPDPSKTGGVDGIVQKYVWAPGQWLVLVQMRIQDNAGLIVRHIPFPLTLGQIGGRPAALFSHIVTAQNYPDGHITVLHCLWEHRDYLMEIQTAWLQYPELVRVAESLPA